MSTSAQSEIQDADARRERRTADLRATDQQFREAIPLAAVTAAIRRPGLSPAAITATIMTGYADRPALGERTREPVTDPATGRTTLRLLPSFDTVTYRDLWTRVNAVAAEWRHGPRHPLAAGEFVGVLGFTSTDYTTLDLACARLGGVCVPLQSSASASALKPIIAETQPRILAASAELLDTAVEIALGSASPRRLIVFDFHPEVDDERERVDAARERLAAAGSPIVLDSLAEVIERGGHLPPAPEPAADLDADRLAMLIYTSGSTGTPKGAMYTDRLVGALWRGFWPRADDLPLIGLNFMPMSHIAGRVTLMSTLANGGTAYFTAASDLSTLFEDIALVRPTELFLVPRICDMLFQRYQSELDRRAADPGDRAAVEAAVRTELRERFLGGRLGWVGSGAAPLSAEMQAFVESCVDLPLHDGFGSTEAGAILLDHKVNRPPVLDYKLVDVPELGYFRTDSPHPRGELLIKSETIIPGYHKRPDVTAEVFDEDGYYRTGDVMAEIGPDELVYVDRRKNVLKLSQGEFVAVSRLEAAFATSPLVRQIYVYGSSKRAYLLAVIVPTEDAINRVDDVEDLRPLLTESLQRIAKDTGLNSYELPRAFLIETEPFSTANGLLSDIRKLLRPKLKDQYGEQLERLYAELAEREANELRALRHAGREQPVLDTVLRAVQALLGCDPAALRADARFMDLGGDSLSALSFSTLLKEIFCVEIPVGDLVSPANDLRRLAERIETAQRSGSKRPTFATVHGAGSTRVRADDLTLEKFIDAETLAAATTLPRPSGPARTVLLTGANGYLGRFLCLEWLERLSGTGGRLVCVVRGSTAAAARERLDAAFDSGDADLVRRFHDLAAEHLEVFAGDIGEPNLGLDEPTWQRLADTVDLIVHPAALVNHVLPYDQLFGPNVVGTAELIRMAITKRLKPFTYLSTVAVIASQAASADEESDIRVTSPVRALDQSYANGYATSKWAGEVLLREAHDRCGLPVATFRSDMILAHSRFSGQLNVSDMFTRLLLSLLATGIAPRSFYETDAEGTRLPAHYDGLPADFTAEAITTLGERAADGNQPGYQTFNVLNPHDDGISLDVFVDWLADAGHPIERIDDYGDWLDRFTTALRALPDRQKQHSLLPLLHAFTRPGEAVRGSGIPATAFRAAVRAAKIGPDKDIPHLSAALIGKYAKDLANLGLV
ncbi:carboxylic acid reductase [Actinokineospora iranica]|uniref:Carboxylic acid reductase n=1 Tax=Actinokineospora iranica TaxID=1271860 RepID=A0A1G6K7R0_9PSEU|nr:carboxylic acid reductase [Actinokineospora iranica]SDC26918.1 fatty acid CoA ligase FadD9 [Actinokineospora iranica]